MRNVDIIKGLRNQNEHLKSQVLKLREKNEHLNSATFELRMVVDAILIAIAKRYGERRDEDGKLLGYRLATPKPDLDDLKRWTVKVQDQGDERIIGVLPKEGRDGSES